MSTIAVPVQFSEGTGWQLLLTSVSAQLGGASDVIVLEGNGVTYFVTKSDPALG